MASALRPSALDRHQGTACLDFALVVVGLFLGNAHARKGADERANNRTAGLRWPAAPASAPAGNDRADRGDNTREDAPADQAAQARTRRGTDSGAFPPLRAFRRLDRVGIACMAADQADLGGHGNWPAAGPPRPVGPVRDP